VGLGFSDSNRALRHLHAMSRFTETRGRRFKRCGTKSESGQSRKTESDVESGLSQRRVRRGGVGLESDRGDDKGQS
jgi:hypothetical protein